MQDRYGFEYVYKLPEEAVRAESVFDFITIDPEEFDYYRVSVGQVYYLWNSLRQYYEVHEVTPYTRDLQLEKYIKQDRVFLLPLLFQKSSDK